MSFAKVADFSGVVRINSPQGLRSPTCAGLERADAGGLCQRSSRFICYYGNKLVIPFTESLPQVPRRMNAENADKNIKKPRFPRLIFSLV